MPTTSSPLKGSPSQNRSSSNISPPTRTFSSTGAPDAIQPIATPTVPQMARFPTNENPAFSETFDPVSVVAQAASVSSSRPLSRSPSRPSAQEGTPPSFTVNFIPPFSINNPYVRPYVASLVYPVEHTQGAGQGVPETSRGRGSKRSQTRSNAEGMDDLYMPRLLSPPPEMYENHWESMSASRPR